MIQPTPWRRLIIGAIATKYSTIEIAATSAIASAALRYQGSLATPSSAAQTIAPIMIKSPWAKLNVLVGRYSTFKLMPAKAYRQPAIRPWTTTLRSILGLTC